MEKVNFTVNVSGLLERSFIVESGIPLNTIGELSLNDGKSCVAKPNSAVRIVYESAYLVSNMSMVLGKCSNISVGSPINKKREIL